MADLVDIIEYCDKRVNCTGISDYPGAYNGLQLENNGTVNKIGAAVDAGQLPFEQAIAAHMDLLIVHHGMYWGSTIPLTGRKLHKIKTCLEGNLAVYSSHLPLDAHPEIGNNAIIAQKLGLKPISTCCEFEGTAIATIAEHTESRIALASNLKSLFPNTYNAIEFGSENPQRVVILSGSGRSALTEMSGLGIDTLITGELRQEHFNFAQEHQFNLYPCGHYATEVFGVQALAAEVAAHFDLPWEFVPSNCPL